MTIYCYNYNNYYNRIVKKEDSLASYGAYVYYEEGVNFNFSDGVDTTQVLNTPLTPNYVLVVDDEGNINSRWFVIDATYTRNGQHVFTLRRDVIADKLDSILDADVFIEKAILPEDNPLIYNTEDMSVNQKKTEEILLKDKTDVAWICGYLARKDFGGEGDPSAEINFTANVIGDIRCEDSQGNLKPIAQYDFIEGEEVFFPYEENLELVAEVLLSNGRNGLGAFRLSSGGWYQISNTGYDLSDYNFNVGGSYGRNPGPTIISNLNTLDISSLENNKIKYSDYYSYFDGDKFNFLTQNNGKIIEASDGFYKLTFDKSYPEKTYKIKTNVDGEYIYSAISSKFSVAPSQDNGAAFLKEKIYLYTVHLVRIQSGNFYIKLPNPEYRYQLKDAPYDMFCIPCPIDKSSVTVKNSAVDNWADIEMTKETAMQFGQGLATSLGSFLYDLQLLPYCPLTIDVDEDGSLDINNNDTKSDGTVNWSLRFTTIFARTGGIVPAYTPKGIILWSLASQGTTRITSLEDIEVDNVKMDNQCDKYRIVSGNYGSTFEINIAKNNGLKNFTADYTYLPYNPYIHVNPDFEGLYGQDFDDCRGLIDQSDKSISYLSDAWTQYQINNKTYQQQFDRQIQNMEVQQKYQRISEIGNAITGTLQGGLSGAAAGSMGGPVGAIVGGVVGTITSAAGGIADIAMNDALRNEAIDYAKDQFGYQLENIQALPQSIAKITAYSINNKVFPILEYYTCTDTEKEAFANKIAYNSMTVMAIGKLSSYVNNTWSYGNITSKGYVKGKLIKIDLDDEDFHIANAISGELNKGVYFNG